MNRYQTPGNRKPTDPMDGGPGVIARQIHIFLVGLIALIPVGIGVLLVDKFWVRRNVPPVAERHAEVAETYGLTLEYESAYAPMLQELLERFPEITGKAHSVGPVLWKEEDGQRLFLFEYKEERRFMTVRQMNVRRRIEGDVGRFGMVVQMPGVELPRWSQASGEAPPVPPWTVEAVQRARAIDDLLLGMEGELFLAVSKPERMAMAEAMDRNRTPEFYTGILANTLHIDVQRVLDVVNLMQTGAPQFARFYEIDLPKIQIDLPSAERWHERMEDWRTGLEERTAEISAAHRERSEEASRQLEEQRQARQAELQANQEARRIQREQEAEARRVQREAERAERAAAFEAQRLERERRTQELLAEQRARTEARLEAIREDTEAFVQGLQQRLDEATANPPASEPLD